MPGRILVIEDNAASLDLMTYLLKAFGHTVLTATDGGEGIDKARRDQPDLIVCDVHLPTVNGYAVARRLKAHPALSQIPLIAVTALAMVGDRDKVLSSGFDGYIDKPIAPETFVGQVDVFLPPHLRSAFPVKHPSRTVVNHVEALKPPDRRSILVLDDSRANLALIRGILTHGGYDVRTAETIEEALALISQRGPDLILSDVHLGKESGVEFLDLVRALPDFIHTPFILISNSLPENGRDTAAFCNFSRNTCQILLRPIEPRRLLDEITSSLRGRGREVT